MKHKDGYLHSVTRPYITGSVYGSEEQWNSIRGL